jgi:3-deoxy-D-manno-octulosonic-acid transferase
VLFVVKWLRNAIYLTVLACLLPWLVFRSWKTGRYRQGLRQKLWGLEPRDISVLPNSTATNLVWLHGVSVGEVQLLKPVIERLRAQLPQARFALSTTTESGMQLAKSSLPTDISCFYYPFDFTWAIRRTLQTLRPSLVVLGELELWPNLIDILDDQEIPVAVINGRLSERSHAAYKRFAFLTRPMFAKLSLVVAQSEANAGRFRDCGALAQTRTCGSIKFDNVSLDNNHSEVNRLRDLVGLTAEDRVWVAGSTQGGEELAAAEAWAELRQEFPTLKLIVVPRHPDRFDAVAKELNQLFDTSRQGKLSHKVPVNGNAARIVRRSELQSPILSSAWDILLVDTVGELRWWWGLAELAMVGGSFGDRGGQNMLEPAGYGANVFFGPNTSNFRDIVDLLLAADGAVQLDQLDSIRPWVTCQLRDPERGRARGLIARRLVAQQQGATERTLHELLSLLPPPRAEGQVIESAA